MELQDFDRKKFTLSMPLYFLFPLLHPLPCKYYIIHVFVSCTNTSRTNTEIVSTAAAPSASIHIQKKCVVGTSRDTFPYLTVLLTIL